MGGFLIVNLLRIFLFKGLIENTSSISQTTGGLVQGNSLGEIRQDFLLLPALPVSIVKNLRCSGLYGTSCLPCGKCFVRCLFNELQSQKSFPAPQ